MSSGVIQSPNYPSSYWGDLYCTWTLQATPTNGSIILLFEEFSTRSCCHFLTIYNESGLVQWFSGTYVPSILKVGSRARIDFITSGSAGSATGMGFSIPFTTIDQSVSTCGDVLQSSGVVQSPNYPWSYRDDTYCTWILQATTAEGSIRLQFQDFSTEACCDFLMIYNESGLVHRFSGTSVPSSLIVGRRARLDFITDGSITGSGFSISFATIDEVSLQCLGLGRFWCSTSRRCIYSSWRCNDARDCLYGEDEVHCQRTTLASTSTTQYEEYQCLIRGGFWCTTTRRCTDPSDRCDGERDCRYGEDEIGCPSTSSNRPQVDCQMRGGFFCSSSQSCTRLSDRCDGVRDCRYGEDEARCSMSGEAIFGIVVGSIAGFAVFIVIIVMACRSVKAHNARAGTRNGPIQLQSVTEMTTVSSPSPACYNQSNASPSSQASVLEPPSYDAAVKAYASGWQASDHL